MKARRPKADAAAFAELLLGQRLLVTVARGAYNACLFRDSCQTSGYPLV
jgi:hypothetical protein